MMTTILHCPNTACRRLSRLADDPLGRIFRCSHCLTKLPTATAAAADSRWTAVLGLPSPGRWRQNVRTTGIQYGVTPRSSVTTATYVGPIRDNSLTAPSYLGLGPDDSGEVLIAPILADSRANLVVTNTSASSISVFEVNQRASDPGATSSSSGSASTLGRFRLQSLLGHGEHATVYRAYDPILERDVALKIPRHGVLKNAKVLARFLGEGKTLARLRHPRIVQVYEAGCAGEQHYIAMALIEGRSLAERLTESPISLHSAAEMVLGLAEALAYAHAQGVIHRDVKPANVRVDAEGTAYLMDFGIAYRPDSGEIPVPAGIILGTPAYLAPEQAVGGQTAVLPASDQYSLGVMFYELLCGRLPFCGPPSYVLFHTVHHIPPSPRNFAPHVPRSLAAICLKALAKRPDDRYENCQQFANDIGRWLSGEAPRAYRRTWAQSRG